MHRGFRQEETIALVEELLANEASVPTRLWRRILWLWEEGLTRWGSRHSSDYRGLGLSRRRRFFYQAHDKITEYHWTQFFKEFTLELDERAIQRTLREFLLFSRGDALTAREVIACRNVEVRSTLLGRLGWERVLAEIGGQVLSESDEGLLIRAELGDHLEPLVVVKVFDSTSGQPYVLRVPPDVRDVHAAIAWTFSLLPGEYQPRKET